MPRTLRAITRNEARTVDRRASEDLLIPTICLMENAGAGAARIAMERWWDKASTAVCVCGPGQNGGDGLVVARHFVVAGLAPRIVFVVPPAGLAPPGDSGANLRICRALGVPLVEVRADGGASEAVSWIADAGMLVDGLFGTGLTRGLDGAPAALVAAMNASGRPVLALDLPSGLDCDTGAPLGPCVRADVTATFVARKIGFENPQSRAWTGEVVVVPIGAPLRSS